MITKTGRYLAYGQEKRAFIVPGVLAAYKTMGLTPEEDAILKEHYGLSDDAFLGLRSFGRGLVGSALLQLPGKLLGSTPAAIAGDIIGAHLGTQKYTKVKAQELLKERESKNTGLSNDDLLKLVSLLAKDRLG